MKQSELFTKVSRNDPKDETTVNAKFLTRGGFIDKTMAGVYSFLPLGARVLHKIQNIVREEMNAVGGQELLMPALQPKELWEATGRWQGFDALFKVPSRFDHEYALGPTHEEVVTPLIKKHLFSYRDLPFGVYQIQTKFRDEARPKSGLLRGREFGMKDFYSFHASQEDLVAYYERLKTAYTHVFSRMGLDSLIVEASGGTFSKYSHEFQVLSPSGEDLVFHCSCGFARNKEVMEPEFQSLEAGAAAKCPNCGKGLRIDAALEVGNIFQLNTKFSEPFGLKYKDEEGKENIVYMGCYGIGTTRAMGAVVEVHHDERGIIWPAEVAPFRAHLLELPGGNGAALYERLQAEGVEVLYDERALSAGEKLAEADLIGIPWRVITSEKTGDKVEVKRRGEKDAKLVSPEEFFALLHS